LHVQVKVDDFVKQGFNSADTSGLTLPALGISTKKGQAAPLNLNAQTPVLMPYTLLSQPLSKADRSCHSTELCVVISAQNPQSAIKQGTYHER